MAYITKTVLVGTDWTVVTSKVALLQFSDEMYMAITDGSTPTEQVGFLMGINEKYINGASELVVFAKAIANRGTGRESVRVAEDDA